MADYTGLYRGAVHDINDPEDRGRLRALVPAVLGDAPSGWAEPALPTSEKVVWRAGDRVWVLFEDGDLNRPVYISRLGVVGDDITPGTITDVSLDPNPTAKPLESPAILDVAGNASGIVLRTEGIEPGTKIEYHVSTTEGFTPNSSTLVATTESIVLAVNFMPDGTPLTLEGGPYFFKTFAYNVQGYTDAGPSAEVSGNMNADVVAELILAQLIVGFILTGAITIGQIEITADFGIRVKKPGGGYLLEIPPDGVTPITATMQIVTDRLKVLNNLAIAGFGQLLGELQMTDGITDPAANEGDINNTWPVAAALNGGASSNPLDPLWTGATTWHGGTTDFVMSIAFFGAIIRKYNKTTGGWGGDLVNPGVQSWAGDFYPWGGISRIGTDYYLLGQDANAGFGDWYLYRVDSATGNVTASKYVASAGTYTAELCPKITTDGTTIYVIWVGSGENTRIRGFNAGLTTETLTATTLESPGGRYGIADAWIDNVDGIGSNRLWVAYRNGPGRVSAFIPGSWNTSGYDFKKPAQNLIGMYYDPTNTQMVTIDNYGRFYHHGKWPLDPVIRMKYAWLDDYDTTGSKHETAPSPDLVLNGETRAQFTVSVPEPPDTNNTDATNLDKANKVAVYLTDDNWATTYREVFDGSEGWTKTYQSFASLATGTPKVTNEFLSADATPGRLMSAAEDALGPLIDLFGSGVWRLGPLSSERCYSRRYRTSNLAITSGTTPKIPWGSESQESGITWDTDHWVAQRPGRYYVKSVVSLTAVPTNSGRMRMDINRNGTSRISYEIHSSNFLNVNETIEVSGEVTLDVGDTVSVSFFTNITGGVTLAGAADDASSQKCFAQIGLVGV